MNLKKTGKLTIIYQQTTRNAGQKCVPLLKLHLSVFAFAFKRSYSG